MITPPVGKSLTHGGSPREISPKLLRIINLVKKGIAAVSLPPVPASIPEKKIDKKTEIIKGGNKTSAVSSQKMKEMKEMSSLLKQVKGY